MKETSKHKLIRNFYIFFIFSLIGWLYEMSLFFIYGNGEEVYNRGFLLGPYLPIYGFGILLIMLILTPLKEKLELEGTKPWLSLVISFLSIVLLTTSLELLASYLLEFLGLEKLWDYSKFSYNFQGRISLRHSIRFGLGGLLSIYVLLPYLEGLIEKIKYGTRRNVAIIIFLIILVDFLHSLRLI